MVRVPTWILLHYSVWKRKAVPLCAFQRVFGQLFPRRARGVRCAPLVPCVAPPVPCVVPLVPWAVVHSPPESRFWPTMSPEWGLGWANPLATAQGTPRVGSPMVQNVGFAHHIHHRRWTQPGGSGPREGRYHPHHSRYHPRHARYHPNPARYHPHHARYHPNRARYHSTVLGATRTMLGTTRTMLGTTPTLLGTTPSLA